MSLEVTALNLVRLHWNGGRVCGTGQSSSHSQVSRYFSVSAMSSSMIPQVSAIHLRVKPLGEGRLFLASMASSQNTIKDIVV